MQRYRTCNPNRWLLDDLQHWWIEILSFYKWDISYIGQNFIICKILYKINSIR